MHNWSRRRFLTRTSGGLGAVLATVALPRNLWGKSVGKPLGIQLWTVNETLQRDPAGTLNRLTKIGFKEVESAAGLARLTPQQMRRLLDDAGLVCASSHLTFDLNNLGKAFEEAHVLGSGYAVSSTSLFEIVNPSLPEAAAQSAWKAGMTLEEAKRAAELANRIGAAAKRAGLQFILHNHNREFVDHGDGAVGYDVLWRDTDPALVQFEIDCGWMIFSGRNPIDYFKKYPGRIPLIHVKDFLPKQNKNAAPVAESMRGAELGRGVVDYKPILAAARQAGVKHFLVEQEGPFSRVSALEAAQVDYDYVRSLN